MKIGILTQPLFNNYGGIIQNYALQRVLLDSGYEVETIDHGRHVGRKVVSILKDWVAFILMPKKHSCPLRHPYSPSKKETGIINKNVTRFVEKYIRRSHWVGCRKDFYKLYEREKYDAIVVGSDQCWRPQYTQYIDEMFLRFTGKNAIKRVAYAVSFGTDKWEMNQKQTELCSSLAKEFDLITVREDSGIKLCEHYLCVEATQVLDPTMLLDKEDYIKLVEEEEGNITEEHGIFCYILDRNAENDTWVSSLAQKSEYEPYYVLPEVCWEKITKERVKRNINDCVYPSLTKWLKSFLEAQLVVVDSFHGAVFSIIFNKPFWILGNKNRGNARFESLLKLYGLEDRFISIDNIKMSDFEWNKKIDWNSVNQIRKEKKIESLNLLLNTLRR